MKKRENIVFSNEDSEFALTIMYPMSGEYEGRLFVLYEDAYGDADLKIMTPEAIAKNYDVSLEEINVFILTVEEQIVDIDEDSHLRPIVKDMPDDYQLDN
jgi:hypothetical protein